MSLDPTQECCICFGSEPPLWQSSCHHFVHPSCFRNYVVSNGHDETSLRCPVCRHCFTDNEMIGITDALHEEGITEADVKLRCALIDGCGIMRRFTRGYRCRNCERETFLQPVSFTVGEIPHCPLHGRRTLQATWLLMTWHRCWVCVDDSNDIIGTCKFEEADDPIQVESDESDTEVDIEVDIPPPPQTALLAAAMAAIGDLEDDENDVFGEVDYVPAGQPEVDFSDEEVDCSDEYAMLVDMFGDENCSTEYDMLVDILAD